MKHRDFNQYDWHDWEGSDYGAGTLTEKASLSEKDILTADRAKVLAIVAKNNAIVIKHAKIVDK